MRILACILALHMLGCGSVESEPDDALRVLFVGNSLTYVNDLPEVVRAMARADSDRPLVVRTVAFPNFSLEDHWRTGSAGAELAGGRWDYVVMQQGPSSLAENQEHLRTWSEKFADEARKSGTEPALFTVWPASEHWSSFPAVLESYSEAASAIEGLLLPAGKAWLLAWEEDPSLELYGSDGFHPSELGTYLSALVIYGGLFDKSVRNVPPVLKIDDETFIQMPQATASILKNAARQVLR
ncbi:MAG TPA: SGNH/GDSL hydrolase family protein [Rhodothermales bacterium]|nr:SGNH/GDSL hydrolase family protein [Rhodothermales bacterium]